MYSRGGLGNGKRGGGDVLLSTIEKGKITTLGMGGGGENRVCVLLFLRGIWRKRKERGSSFILTADTFRAPGRKMYTSLSGDGAQDPSHLLE